MRARLSIAMALALTACGGGTPAESPATQHADGATAAISSGATAASSSAAAPSAGDASSATSPPKLPDDVADAFAKMVAFIERENPHYLTGYPEYDAQRDRVTEHFKAHDVATLEGVFWRAEKSSGTEKRVADDLLAFVGSYWRPTDDVRDRAVRIATTHPDAEFREGALEVLAYQYEPAKVTPPLLAAFAKSKDAGIRRSILDELGSKAPSCFIDGNEKAIFAAATDALAHDPPETRLITVELVAELARKDDAARASLAALAKDADPKVAEKAKGELEHLKK
jgi:hypothetical protein